MLYLIFIFLFITNSYSMNYWPTSSPSPRIPNNEDLSDNIEIIKLNIVLKKNEIENLKKEKAKKDEQKTTLINKLVDAESQKEHIDTNRLDIQKALEINKDHITELEKRIKLTIEERKRIERSLAENNDLELFKKEILEKKKELEDTYKREVERIEKERSEDINNIIARYRDTFESFKNEYENQIKDLNIELTKKKEEFENEYKQKRGEFIEEYKTKKSSMAVNEAIRRFKLLIEAMDKGKYSEIEEPSKEYRDNINRLKEELNSKILKYRNELEMNLNSDFQVEELKILEDKYKESIEYEKKQEAQERSEIEEYYRKYLDDVRLEFEEDMRFLEKENTIRRDLILNERDYQNNELTNLDNTIKDIESELNSANLERENLLQMAQNIYNEEQELTERINLVRSQIDTLDNEILDDTEKIDLLTKEIEDLKDKERDYANTKATDTIPNFFNFGDNNIFNQNNQFEAMSYSTSSIPIKSQLMVSSGNPNPFDDSDNDDKDPKKPHKDDDSTPSIDNKKTPKNAKNDSDDDFEEEDIADFFDDFEEEDNEEFFDEKPQRPILQVENNDIDIEPQRPILQVENNDNNNVNIEPQKPALQVENNQNINIEEQRPVLQFENNNDVDIEPQRPILQVENNDNNNVNIEARELQLDIGNAIIFERNQNGILQFVITLIRSRKLFGGGVVSGVVSASKYIYDNFIKNNETIANNTTNDIDNVNNTTKIIDNTLSNNYSLISVGNIYNNYITKPSYYELINFINKIRIIDNITTNNKEQEDKQNNNRIQNTLLLVNDINSNESIEEPVIYNNFNNIRIIDNIKSRQLGQQLFSIGNNFENIENNNVRARSILGQNQVVASNLLLSNDINNVDSIGNNNLSSNTNNNVVDIYYYSKEKHKRNIENLRNKESNSVYIFYSNFNDKNDVINTYSVSSNYSNIANASVSVSDNNFQSVDLVIGKSVNIKKRDKEQKEDDNDENVMVIYNYVFGSKEENYTENNLENDVKNKQKSNINVGGYISYSHYTFSNINSDIQNDAMATIFLDYDYNFMNDLYLRFSFNNHLYINNVKNVLELQPKIYFIDNKHVFVPNFYIAYNFITKDRLIINDKNIFKNNVEYGLSFNKNIVNKISLGLDMSLNTNKIFNTSFGFGFEF